MNNNIILKALQTQLQTIQTEAIDHEKSVFEPAAAKLVEKVKTYFEQHVFQGIFNIELGSERITIYPTDTTGYGNTITIEYRSSWRSENAYFETSSYRPDLDSREDNTNTKRYHQCMAAVASAFDLICNEWKTKWMPAFGKLEAAKSEKYNGIWTIEQEIRRVEKEIADDEKQVYNKAGYECTLKPYANYSSDYSGNNAVYTKEMNDHTIAAHYGRGRWDYARIHSFKVVSFPKAKHSKVVLSYKMNSTDEHTRTIELNKQRYADFISSVYEWQTKGAEQREAQIDERIENWNK